MKMNVFLFTSVALSLFGLFISCDSDETEEKKTPVVINLGGEMQQGGLGNLVIDENNPLNYYNRIDSSRVYGYGVDCFIPDSLKDCDLKFVISGKMRESESINGSIVVVFHGMADSISYWGELHGGNYIKQPNAWVGFKDSLIVERSLNNARVNKFKIFPYKTRGKGFFDVDDLIIKVTRE